MADSIAVEVKSALSSEADIVRGMFQYAHSALSWSMGD
jgi:hypothetical protein